MGDSKDNSQVYGLVDSFTISGTVGGRKILEKSKMWFLWDMLILKYLMENLGR